MAKLSRRQTVFVVTFICVTIPCVLYYSLGNRPRPCRATFDLVKKGMTIEEGVATIGAPPGDYRTSRHVYLPPSMLSSGTGIQWITDDAELSILPDESGRVELIRIGKMDDLRGSIPWHVRVLERIGL